MWFCGEKMFLYILKYQICQVKYENIDNIFNKMQWGIKDDRSISLICCFYQTAHLLVGFIWLFSWQWKSEANWGMFANGPRTRKRDGECCPVKMSSFKLCGRDFSHQMLAAAIQNNWRRLIRKKCFKTMEIMVWHTWTAVRAHLNSARPGRRASTWSQFSDPFFCRFAHLM